jgi:hypothetical protein
VINGGVTSSTVTVAPTVHRLDRASPAGIASSPGAVKVALPEHILSGPEPAAPALREPGSGRENVFGYNTGLPR